MKKAAPPGPPYPHPFSSEPTQTQENPSYAEPNSLSLAVSLGRTVWLPRCCCT
jgi:hypothetical protein